MPSKLILLILASLSLSADPWGKDADLAGCSVKKPPEGSLGPLQTVSRHLIKFHQNNISKTDGPRSHYYPSSSQYTLLAIEKYGFFYGYLLGCDRLMRENNDPWVYATMQGKYNQLKFDPVR